jgi:hypothetical protein
VRGSQHPAATLEEAEHAALQNTCEAPHVVVREVPRATRLPITNREGAPAEAILDRLLERGAQRETATPQRARGQAAVSRFGAVFRMEL